MCSFSDSLIYPETTADYITISIFFCSVGKKRNTEVTQGKTVVRDRGTTERNITRTQPSDSSPQLRLSQVSPLLFEAVRPTTRCLASCNVQLSVLMVLQA